MVTLAQCRIGCEAGFQCPTGSMSARALDCTAGYACPGNTTALTAALMCPRGRFAPARSAACFQCPLGRFGADAGATSEACTGACFAAPGLQCAAGAVNATGAPCTAGTASSGGLSPCAPVNTVELAALSALYNATGGLSWRNATLWGNPTASVCTWAGVRCDASSAAGSGGVAGFVSTVAALDLRDNNLAGSVPSAITGLTGLSALALDSNRLTGSLPAVITRLTRLVSLSGCGNDLSGVLPAFPATVQQVRLTLAQCGAPCEAGFACPPGSLSPRSVECPPGRFAAASTQSLLECPRCRAGRFGSASRAMSEACSGECAAPAGNFCPEGSLTAEGVPCPAGFTSSGGAAATCEVTKDGEGAAGDAAALAALYAATGGPSWSLQGGSSWAPASAAPACNRTGVACNTVGRVVGLSLPGAGLTGSLPDALSALSLLTRLDLGMNALGGSLPVSLSALTGLQIVRLCGNALSGRDTLAPPPAGAPSAGRQVTLAQCGGGCAPGFFCPAGSLSATAEVCVEGAACPANSTAPATCPRGRWAEARATACSPCAAGRFGAAEGATSRNCTGVCDAAPGAACAEGETSPTGQACPTGTASRGGVTQCVPVSLAQTSALAALLASLGAGALTPISPTGSGLDFARSVCTWPSVTCAEAPAPAPTGATVAPDVIAALDLTDRALTGSLPTAFTVYSALSGLTALRLGGNPVTGTLPAALATLPSLAVLTLCGNALSGTLPAELAAARITLRRVTLAECGGVCSAGFFCPVGALSGASNRCPAGSFCAARASAPMPCPAGRFSSAAAAVECALCPAGRFGGAVNTTSPNCTGPCTAAPGNVCLVGATSQGGVPCTAALTASDPVAAAACAANPVQLGSVAGDTAALLSLFSSAGGASWLRRAGWSTTGGSTAGATSCAWSGVGCSTAGRVVSLDLSLNNLSGVIPDSLVRGRPPLSNGPPPHTHTGWHPRWPHPLPAAVLTFPL
jgi:hypothetical protein